ncbi:carboxypeptidase-like regulatory domain-containing protein [Maribellus sp. YY47]|uniref:MSCRAMM family protein n=1 Tax=Maribellus sp. YY47 TaxID=2929486 RepID=UPI0020007E9D|nr:carboxypeptidase-like regulatory domain-containing protein [Maribellus sp. YY47]MCK3682878.1 carboxypeptidase-like regulatory domain-containing protein [Maribellus sp. YY47]
MKLIKILRSFVFVALMGTVLFSVNSCQDDDESGNIGFGTVVGTVTDADGTPVSDVTVTISGVNEEDITVTSGTDGTYTADNVSMKTHAVKFSKEGWLTVSVTVTAEKFDANKVVAANATLVNASAKITGTIIDAKNGGTPLADVTVSVGPAGSATSGSDGKYEIGNMVAADYTITFTKANYVTITKAIVKDDFVDGVVSLDVQMGGQELLRGLTADDLSGADKWYYNEYRGGGNADAYPHWDWACDYMCSLTFWGNWEEQWEGTTLRIRNDEDQRSNPADLDVFDSYTYGSKLITEDNKIMSLRIRTHNADEASPAYFGVQVIDLSAAQPTAVKVGDTKTWGSGNYTDFDFDLSDYVGKEVIIAVGIYRQQTGDYWKQLVLRAIRFADRKVENWDWLPGTDVVDGWKLSIETARSTMPHIKSSFTGISPISAGRNVSMSDGYPVAYHAWRDVAHVGAEWSFVPLRKDPEVFPSEGYIIKTRNTPDVDTKVPESYLYAKFSIASGHNQLTFSTRNFGSNYTFFKITAIQDNGTVTHLTPQSNTAQEASAANDGCWKFKHGDGGAGNPEGYASFVYDLSQFNGENVTIVLGVYNGAANTGENKLVIHTIDLN